MDEQQLHSEFMSILSESHPGLTFEEYRDSCIFLLTYQYLCLRYTSGLREEYKLQAMVHMAVRGRLQIDSFLKFVEAASGTLSKLCPEIALTELSYYKRLYGPYPQEKQKSLARFIRKLIKKINAWNEEPLLLKNYGEYFYQLILEFARMKKRTYLSEEMMALLEIFLEKSLSKEETHFFQPEFNYGILLNNLLKSRDNAYIYGYEDTPEMLEVCKTLCFMRHRDSNRTCICTGEAWKSHGEFLSSMDGVLVYMPEGVEAGTLVSSWLETDVAREMIRLKTRGELPFLLSALSYLKEDGELAAVMPSALLYREGREMLARKYLVEEKNWLDTIVMLPDQMFDLAGQDEVLLYFRKNRSSDDVMFYNCSEISFDREELAEFKKSREERVDIPGYCACVSRKVLKENDYNLNIPRYISKSRKEIEIDLETRKARIREIEEEIREIENKMDMYRRDLSIRVP